ALAEARRRLVRDFEGAANQTVDARVEDPGLREALGETLPLRFSDDNWDDARFNGQDVQVLLRGEYRSMSGTRVKAPLLLKLQEAKGTVISTSFHNEPQNSDKELELLRSLVFSAATAREETMARQTMLSGGFSPVKQSQASHGSGTATVTRAYTSTDSAPLRF